MLHSHFIIGGARSGKSRHALVLAERVGNRRVFVATAEACDDEMAKRIALHRGKRGPGWTTLEAPLDLVAAIDEARRRGDVCLIDCLTIWLSNLMRHDRDVEKETAQLCEAIACSPIPILLVSNEVGMGLVPETPLGRAFRDEQGRLNQVVASVCDRVEFIAAGLPIILKG